MAKKIGIKIGEAPHDQCEAQDAIRVIDPDHCKPMAGLRFSYVMERQATERRVRW